MSKPGIIVVSQDGADSFEWLSDGWHTIKLSHTAEAKRLMGLAHDAIEAGESVPDVIRRLEAAGFAVTRRTTGKKSRKK
jgi:hypothetical protein